MPQIPVVVNKFRGLSQHANQSSVGMDQARDLMNVIVSESGHLEKMRAPVLLTAPYKQDQDTGVIINPGTFGTDHTMNVTFLTYVDQGGGFAQLRMNVDDIKTTVPTDKVQCSTIAGHSELNGQTFTVNSTGTDGNGQYLLMEPQTSTTPTFALVADSGLVSVWVEIAPFPLVGPSNMWDFQRADGLRHLICVIGSKIFVIDKENYTAPALLIDDNPLNVGRWSFVTSNNICYMCNGKRAMRWDGAKFLQWGIDKPATAPSFGYVSQAFAVMTRTSNIVTVPLNTAVMMAGFAQALPNSDFTFVFNPEVGDIIKVTNSTDSSFNGQFKLTAVVYSGTVNLSWSNPGPNATNTVSSNPDGLYSGKITTFRQDVGSFAGSPTGVIFVSRLAGVSTIQLQNPLFFRVGEHVVVSGLTGTDASFNGTWLVSAITSIITLSWLQTAEDTASHSPTGTGVVNGGVSTAVGPRLYRYAWRDAITGEEGSMSDPSPLPPPDPGIAAHYRVWVNSSLPPAGQGIDTIVWYATLDGGGDFFFHSQNPITQLCLDDGRDDTLINTAIRGSLINNPAPIGTYLTKGHNRIFIHGIPGALQDVAYSGYERITVGRPESCFPPNNRLRLAIGADAVQATGMLQTGVVIWSRSNEMFIFKGAPEDIVTDAPVQFTAQLDELPWHQGANSHYSVQNTPRGVQWWASDESVQLWNGAYFGDIVGPKELSVNIAPILQRSTRGYEFTAQSAWFNWQEREWYVLALGLDGSTTFNRLLIFDMAGSEIFMSDTPCESISLRESSDGTTHLFIGSLGGVWELPVLSEAIGGVAPVKTSTPATMAAWWQSGWAGNDNPETVKLFRTGHLITDQGGMALTTQLVDDETYTFLNPLIKVLKFVFGNKFATNWKARRQSFTIIFPSQDVTCNVQELRTSYNESAER